MRTVSIECSTNPVDTELTYLAPSNECAVPLKWQVAFNGLDLMKKNETDEITVFLHFYVYLFFILVFFLESLQTVNKTVSYSHPSPLQHEHYHWGIGRPGYTFESAIQTRAISPPSCGSAPPCDYRYPIEFPMGVPIFN